MSLHFKGYSEDEVILRIVSFKESHLFSIIYERYFEKVLAKCQQFAHHDEDALDWAQEIMIRVFHKLPKFKGTSRFSTWLYSVAHHYCIDMHRRRKKNLAIQGLEVVMQLPAIIEGDEEGVEQEEALQRSLKTLDPDELQLIQWKYNDGLSIQAISEKTGLGASAVKMRLSRIRTKIQKDMGQEKGRELVGGLV